MFRRCTLSGDHLWARQMHELNFECGAHRNTSEMYGYMFLYKAVESRVSAACIRKRFVLSAMHVNKFELRNMH